MPSDVALSENHLRPSPPAGLRWAAPVLLAVAATLAYASSFSGSFVLDDHRTILNNTRIRQLLPLSEVLSGRRPVVDATLAINYALGELNVGGYHAVNLLIHLLAGLTLYGIVARTLVREPLRARFGQAAPCLAIVVATLWLVHPLQTQAVTYVIQRSESLMGLFYLLTLYCLIRGVESPRAWAWYGAGAIACGLGFGCKAVMVTAPVAVLLYDRLFFSRSLVQTIRQRWGFYLALSGTWSILWMTGVLQGVLSTERSRANVGFSYLGISPLDYLVTQAGVIAHYLRLSLWPQPLCLDHRWPVAETLGAIVPPALLVAGLLIATMWACARKPSLGYIGAWFFLILSPTSSFVPIRDPAFEHRMYLPLAAVIVGAVCGAYVLGVSLSARLAVADRVRRVLTGCVVVCVALSLGTATYQRNFAYHGELTMWQDVVSKRPTNHRGHYNLGRTLLDAGRLEEAAQSLQRAIQIEPDSEQALYNLGKTRALQGKTEEAVKWYVDALRANPSLAAAHSDIGNILARQNRIAEAIGRYEEAIRRDPSYVRAYANLGSVLLSRQRGAEAVEVLREAVRVDPNIPRIHFLLGRALLANAASGGARPTRSIDAGKAGLLDGRAGLPAAVAEFREALKLDPDHAGARQALDDVLRRLGSN